MVLRQTCIQANVNVVELEPTQDSTFDYWLKISTLAFRKQLFVPVKLAAYHRQTLEGKTINTSVTLNKRGDGWWLTLSYDEVVPLQTEPSAPVVGVDVGIANFLTTSDGQHYGTFHGKLRARQKRDREKRRRKAKLRQCLEKKGVKKLPSTSSKSGQRLARHVRQEINHAVNQCFTEHPDAQFAYEQLSVATMKYKARAMNAYLYASNLAHIPKQLAWNAAKRGRAATKVKCAYSSGCMNDSAGKLCLDKWTRKEEERRVEGKGHEEVLHEDVKEEQDVAARPTTRTHSRSDEPNSSREFSKGNAGHASARCAGSDL